VEIKELLEKIEFLRELMHIKISQCVKLFDPDVVKISQELDLLLNQYTQLSTSK
jgi:hypothetical protein